MNVAKIIVLLAMSLLVTSFASAQNLDVLYVKINGEVFDPSVVGAHTDNLKVERGEELDVTVRVQALADARNVQVEADIYGYRYSHRNPETVSDTSKVFDLDTGDIDTVDLSLKVPTNIDKKYTLLRLRVADEDGFAWDADYQLHIFGVDDEDAVVVDDVEISPSSVINAGRAFTANVRVENIGDDDLDDVKVTVSVPELNIRDSEFLDELDADEKETLEEFLLRVPDCAAPGVYDVEINVEFDEYESTSESTTIEVIPGDTCSASRGSTSSTQNERVVVTVSDAQDVNTGSESAFPILISNLGTVSKTFTVGVNGVSSWGTSRVSPSSVVVVPAGESETVFVYVKPNEDVSGEQVFVATVTSEGEAKDIPLTANVVGTSSSDSVDLKRGLEVALVVLVIILIIIGLIIGFNKLRGQDDGPQTYY